MNPVATPSLDRTERGAQGIPATESQRTRQGGGACRRIPRAYYSKGGMSNRTPSQMSRIHELSRICAEQNPQPADQRRRIIALLKAGADIHATDKNGVTALHHAVRFRNPVAVRTLIEHGANVNQRCRKAGSTPLHRAVTQTGAPYTAGKREEALEIIRLLMAAGADASITNRLGRKPADYVRDQAIKSLIDPHHYQ
jgi:uncharacterized protein